MRSLSIVAVACLGTALSIANAQQVKHSPPTKGQHTTLKSANGQTHLSPLLGTHNTNPAKPLVATNGQSHTGFVSGGSDACGTATPISGPGPFAGDNAGSTTDGPSNCGFMASDVWYDWTAGFSGPATLSFCGSTMDTVVSVYDGVACTGPLLGCNDDSCAFQSSLTVNVVNTQHYRIQVGGYNGAQGNYSFGINAAPTCPCGPDTEGEGAPCGINQDFYNGGCNSTPVVYSTIACGGSVCGNGAFNGSYRDTDWYALTLGPGTWQVTWTCTAEFNNVTGILDYNNCPNVTIFDFDFGTACSPTTSTYGPVTGPTTIVLFAAPDFSQIINCGTNDTYHGDVTCTPVAPPGPCDSLDDGSSENAVGFGAPTGTEILWMQVGGSPGVTMNMDSMETCWGTLAFPGNGPTAGSTQRIGIWQDNDGGDPTTGLVLLTPPQGIPALVTNVDNDQFDEYIIDPPIVVTGQYWIGASSEGAFPSPLDQSQSGAGRSWIVGSTTGAGTIDYNNLNAATVPPLNEDSVAPGVWMIRPDCDLWGTFEYECFGDNSIDDEAQIATCPCGNVAVPNGNGHGCANSDHTGGAILSIAAGSVSITAHNLQFQVTGHHLSSLCVFFAGNELFHDQRIFSGDGVRCVGSPLRRIYILPANVVTITTPGGGSPNDVATRDGLINASQAGANRGYYMAYRDPVASFCPTATFNTTNSCSITWGP